MGAVPGNPGDSADGTPPLPFNLPLIERSLPDADNDGYPAPADCDDADPLQHTRCYALSWGDLHTHTNLSQDGCEDETNGCLPSGFYPGEEALANGAAEGVAFMAITDHAEHLRYEQPAAGIDLDIWASAQALVQEAEGGPVIAILGYEYSARFGHRSVLLDADEACPELRKSAEPGDATKEELGLETYPYATTSGYLTSAEFVDGMNLAATLPGCEGVRWISFFHHPAYAPPCAVDWASDAAPAVTDRVVEIASEHGSSECADPTWDGCDFRDNSEHHLLGSSVQAALQLGYRLGFVGGSDNHQGHPARLDDGPGYTGMLVDTDKDGISDSFRQQFSDGALTGVYHSGGLTRTAIFDAIDARNTLAATWPFDGLTLHAVDTFGGVYLPGDDIPAQAGALSLVVDLTDPNVDAWYAEVVDPWTGATDVSGTVDLSAGQPRYVRIRAWVGGVEQRIWASPFFPA